MIIKETFDSSYTISHGVEYDPPDMYAYEFDTGSNQDGVRHGNSDGSKYVVNFEKSSLSDIPGENRGTYHFQFSQEYEDAHEEDFPSDERNYDITGSGNEFKVFGTVINTVRIFLNEYKGELKSIIFTAEKSKPSRVRLYNRLVKTLSKSNNFNYHIKEGNKLVTYYLYPMTFKNEYERL
jgi:hypothetical protein